MRAKIFLAIPGLLLMLAVGVWVAEFSLAERPTLAFTAFDIGQGDALFVETPDRYQMLIDGGPSSLVVEKLANALPFWDRSLDLIILTHPHADHVTGLIDVLKRYRVGAVIEPNAKYGTAEYAEWKREETAEHVPSYTARAGMEVLLGRYARIRILSPQESAEGKDFKNIHDANVAAELAFGSTTFLFAGDLEAKGERVMLSRGLVRHVNVLKVGHHGSRTSSSEEFLKALSPRIAVISVGAHNRYGHPHQEILDRLARFGIKIFRTDQNGDVKILSDGVSLSVASVH